MPRVPTIGVIANPFSSRDIRRLVSSATTIQTVERANIVERVITTLEYFGESRVLVMPDRAGLTTYLARRRDRKTGIAVAEVEFLDMPITATEEDTELAAAMLHEEGADAVLVLGGDGTHRVVSKEIGTIPLASVSTGTNNAFPRFYEATTVGMALGIYAHHLVPRDQVIRRNKSLSVEMNGKVIDRALVDVAITRSKWAGAKALWDMSELLELYLAFCEPCSIGMSAIGGLLQATSRESHVGLRIMMAPMQASHIRVSAPVLPGRLQKIGVLSVDNMQMGAPHDVEAVEGMIGLDGEREIQFFESDIVSVTLNQEGPLTIDVEKSLALAMQNGVFVESGEDGSAVRGSLRHEKKSISDGDVLLSFYGFSELSANRGIQ